MNCLVDGNILLSFGFFSFSVLVCCVGLVMFIVLGRNLFKVEFVEICVKSECYIGIEGGGMD